MLLDLFLILSTLLTPSICFGASIGPIARVVGDGSSSTRFMILTDSVDERVSVKADGAILRTDAISGGYLVEWRPPSVSEITDGEIVIEVKEGEVTTTVTKIVTIYPDSTSTVTIGATQSSVSAGSSVTIEVKLSGEQEQEAPPLLSCSIGSIDDIASQGNGRWTATYTAPADLSDPTIAVFTGADPFHPTEAVSAFALPITVTQNLTFETLPDAEATLTVGQRTFGPYRASPAGTIAFDAELHSAYPKVTMVAIAPDGEKQKLKKEFPFKEINVLGMAPLPDTLPEGRTVQVTAWCFDAAANPCNTKDLKWTALEGAVQAVESSKNGPARGLATMAATGLWIQARLGSEIATAQAKAIPAPVSYEVTLKPVAIPQGERVFEVIATGRTPDGAVHTDSPVEISASDAMTMGRTKKDSTGRWVGKFSLKNGIDESVIRLSPHLTPTGLPAIQLIAWSERNYRYWDGAPVSIFIAAEDALGLGVPHVNIDVELVGVDGVSSLSLTTDQRGISRIDVPVSDSVGVTTIEATTGSLSAATALWMGPQSEPIPALPIPGSIIQIKAVKRWQAYMPATYLIRAEAIQIVEVAAPTADAIVLTVANTTDEASDTESTTIQPSAEAPVVSMLDTALIQEKQSPNVRIRGAAILSGLTFSQTPDTAGAAYSPAAQLEFGQTEVLGFDSSIETWFPGQKWGLAAAARMQFIEGDVRGSHLRNYPIEAWAGIRRRVAFNNLVAVSFGVDAEKGSGLIYAWSDVSQSDVLGLDYPLFGARLSTGARLESGELLVKLEVAQTLAPFPVQTRLDLTLDIPIPGSKIDLTISGEMERRSMTYQRDDGTLSTQRDARQLRVGLLLPLF